MTDSREYDSFGLLIASSGTTPTPFGFVGGEGYQRDADSGLMLLGARYYDPSIGRFISRDPIGYEGGLNLYGYCENDPTHSVDPSGKNPWDTIQRFIRAARRAYEAWRVARAIRKAQRIAERIQRMTERIQRMLDERRREAAEDAMRSLRRYQRPPDPPSGNGNGHRPHQRPPDPPSGNGNGHRPPGAGE